VIVHIITELAHGGAETALFRLLTANSNPTEFHVISLSDDGVFGPRIRGLGVGVTSLHMRQRGRFPIAFIRLVILLRRLHPDLVQTWMYHANVVGGLASRLAGIPVCWGIRQANLSVSANKRGTLRIAKVGAWLSNWVPCRIVSCSHRAVTAHEAFGYASNFAVVPNGVDLSSFSPNVSAGKSKRSHLSVPTGFALVGHVGRFDVQKDYPTLFAACSRLRELHGSFKVVLCGKNIDANNSELVSLLRAHNLEEIVIMLGQRDDVPELMQGMDVLVLSSLGEAFPNVVAEAMAVGVPCAVTDVGDAAEIVGDTGWVVPPGNPTALADAIAAALREPPSAQAERKRRARGRIEENYDITRMVSGFRAVWNEFTPRRDGICVG
jgi:glycosyltransferase involved in cell wall biosynthesis